jgi:hypothetical protein
MKIFGFSISGVGFIAILGGIRHWFSFGEGMHVATIMVGCAITITGFIISALASRNK